MTRQRLRINLKPAYLQALQRTGATGLEPAASGVTGRRSNQLSYAPRGIGWAGEPTLGWDYHRATAPRRRGRGQELPSS